MKNLFDIEGTSDAIAIHNGTFNVNGYVYSWRISKTFGIYMKVGGLSLVSYNDSHIGGGCGSYGVKDNEGFYYHLGNQSHYGVFVDNWAAIRQTILSTCERVKGRRSFEP